MGAKDNAAALEALMQRFDDGGAAVLAAAGLPAGAASWSMLLMSVPPDEPVSWLRAARDRHEALGQQEAALVLTEAVCALLAVQVEQASPEGEGMPFGGLALAQRYGIELGRLGQALRAAGRRQDAVRALNRGWKALADDPRLAAVQVAVGELLGAVHLEQNEPVPAVLAWTHTWASARVALEVARRPRQLASAAAAAARVAGRISRVHLRRGARAEAIPWLTAAWQVARDFGVPGASSVGRTLAAALESTDAHGEAAEVLRELHAAADDPAERATLAAALGQTLAVLEQPEEALRLLDGAVRWLRDHPDEVAEAPVAMVQRWSTLARLRAHRADMEGAMGLLHEARQLATQTGDVEAVALAEATLGRWAVASGQLDEAVGWLESAAAQAPDLDEVQEALADAALQRASLAHAEGDLDLAVALAERVMGIDLPPEHTAGRSAAALLGRLGR